MPAVALTDWNNLYGSLYLWKATKATQGAVKPIYGLELGVRVEEGGDLVRHLVLLAKNKEGFKNLCQLSTAAHCDFGFSQGLLKPFVPLDFLKNYSEGLIALSGGLKGILGSFVLQDQDSLALQSLRQLKEIYKDSFYLEMQDIALSVQDRLNEWVIDAAKKESLPLIATNDAHYLSAEDAFAQEIWMMVEQKCNLEENPRTALQSHDFFLKSAEQMKEAFVNHPEAIENSLKIANLCNVNLKFSDESGKRIYYLPTFESEGLSQEELFKSECTKGLQQRFDRHNISEDRQGSYRERLDFEIKTICQMGFAGYYLIVSDFIRWAKSHGIVVGPGRGSGAGSLAAYVLDITDLDPIEHGLLFERFLNPERVSLPDFDIDFCQERRHEVIQYVSEKYGSHRVCQIVTFAKAQSKNAIKDVGRVLGLSFGESNRITKLVPVIQAKPLSVKEALDEVEELRELAKMEPKVRQTLDLSQRVEGALRQPGVHAAGVIIAGQALKDLAPLSKDVNGNLITQWDMKMSEEAGLVKFDFLGLVTLDLLDLACKLIHNRSEPEAKALTPYNIPIHDPRAYELIAKGNTLGVFQLESTGMQNLCVRMKPDRFGDITAINSLFRPGPLESGMVDDFINRKHGRAKVEVIFPEMEEILRETYGVIVYQEQVLQLARSIAGYSLGAADILRRAMGKKNVQEMAQQREAFVKGAEAAGKSAEKAGELFDLIEKFAGYGFNKSHAAAYAQLAVQTAYLKAVYPSEFYAALFTIEQGNTDKLSRYIQDAKKNGLKILAPDVNESDAKFTIIEEGVIRFGLSAIKNVGESAVEAITAVRKQDGQGPFKDLFNFLERVDVKRLNKRMLECLIQAGGFDSLDESAQHSTEKRQELRGRYLATLERALEWATKAASQKEQGQFSLFDFSGKSDQSTQNSLRPVFEKGELPSEKSMLDWEKQLLGIYISSTPLAKYRSQLEQLKCQPIFSLGELPSKSKVMVGAWVSEFRELRIKRGRRAGEFMGVLRLEDESGSVELVSFPDHFKEYSHLFRSGDPLLVRADLEFEEDTPRLIGGDVGKGARVGVELLSEFEVKWPKALRVHINVEKLSEQMPVQILYSEMSKVLKKHPGTVPVELCVKQRGAFSTKLHLGPQYEVSPGAQLIEDVAHLVTLPGCLHVEEVY